MRVEDYFVLRRRGWVGLHEKAARNTKKEYIAGAGIALDRKVPLFHTTGLYERRSDGLQVR